ncbi:hypothetical protein Tsubulata_006149 [Turnera subulata]|uniref:RING-type E3 ubiquitin transferase n=1 Tax=Turnera subulata TaxID=218843 RepID=A0A9Q0JAZ3_9ROSI|nr:hypothetical protein Tsubulata_006149 [Turnera subulata]
MASRFQGVALVASPSYPNSVAWSEENLIAVTCGHLVTILNPALPFGPRGLITIPSPTSKPYPIGRIKPEDLLTSCMLPTALSRDRRPCVRSISWSPIGMAPNYGCLLAVCTVEGRVKIYRPPYCDFCAEWIEVADISDMLYDHLSGTNFGELEMSSSDFATEQEGCADNQPVSCADDLPNSRTRTRRMRITIYVDKDYEDLGDQSSNFTNVENVIMGPASKVTENKSAGVEPTSRKRGSNVLENCKFPLSTGKQYASRSAMLSSLVVAWSSMLSSSSGISSSNENASSSGFSILAVGDKAGNISLWRMLAPQCYSIEKCSPTACIMFAGLVQAHSSWTTAISFGVSGSKSCSEVVLASGSSDGSVKIWLGKFEGLLDASEANKSHFFLLKEVISVNSIPVSVLSLVVPPGLQKIFLAVGKGSGSFEAWTCEMSGSKVEKVGSYNGHDCIVTGLAWAFDGRCLYSCGQDNYVRCWVLRGNSLSEEPIPPNTPNLRGSSEIPSMFLSCLGLTASPGNLAVAMVRNFDIDQLDHMYEARLQKAAVEFFWIGGQQLDMSPPDLGFCYESLVSSASELACWESNIMWSLTRYENVDKPLVVWDVIAALLAFKQSNPQYIEHILIKWLSKTFLSSNVDLSVHDLLSHIPQNFSKITTRKLHLLNIICRRVALSELKADDINNEITLRGPSGGKGEKLTPWMELLFRCERELRERLVGFSFSAVLNNMFDSTTSCKPGCWCPVGVAQMQQWVALNSDHVSGQLKALASEVKKHQRRHRKREFGVEELCVYCSAIVPFESPDVAHCQNSEGSNGVIQNHKLARCAVSMQICPATSLWFCKCCHRWTSKLAPEAHFTIPRYPIDFKSLTKSSFMGVSKPFCPFCGVLLQRSQPEFLLAASPVKVEVLKSVPRVKQLKELGERLDVVRKPLVVAISGRVGSETPINCQYSGLRGVIVEETAAQHFLVKRKAEHNEKHNHEKAWVQDSTLMLSTSKEVPWYLDDETDRVHVLGARGAPSLVLTVSGEVFEESERSDATLDCQPELQMIGLKRIESVLPIGTSLTVVGELFPSPPSSSICDQAFKDDMGTVHIQRSPTGLFEVSPESVDQLIGSWEELARCCKHFSIFWATLGVGLTVFGVLLVIYPEEETSLKVA